MTITASLRLDAEQFLRALEQAIAESAWLAFVDYQRQLARDSLRVTVERTERRLFGYIGAHRGED